MKLGQAMRVLNAIEAKYRLQKASPFEMHAFCSALPAGKERDDATEASHTFARAQASGDLGKVMAKCMEIAALNKQGGNLEDLFDAACEMVGV